VTAEYERYHGIVLRELIVKAPSPLLIEARDDAGRVNSFCLNGQTGLHIKHSAKRLAPWQFTFNEDSLAEIDGLIDAHASFWLVLVCGLDGVAALTAEEFRVLTAVKNDVARFIRVDRDRNTMYRIFGNAGKLQGAKARGVVPVVFDALAVRPKRRRRKLAA
jgi:hypothetical protein